MSKKATTVKELQESNREWTLTARRIVAQGYTPKRNRTYGCTFHKGTCTVALVRTYGEPWRVIIL